MEEQYHDYTLNFITATGEDLYAATQGYIHLQEEKQLTPELAEAYKALVASCEEFLKVYSRYH